MVRWKRYIVEEDIWERLENLKNVKELIEEFEEKLRAEVRRVEEIDKRWKAKLNLKAEEFRRGKLSGRYMAKLLYGWDDKKFDEEYLKKLERNWNR